jgi:hypothetical protein
MAAELGFGCHTYQDVYSSDSTPFADKGIPAVSFARWAPNNTATIHNSYDTPAVMSASQTAEDIDFIVALTFELLYKLLFELCFTLITHLFSSFVSIMSIMSVISQLSVPQILTRTSTPTLSFLPSFASTFVEKPALRRNSVLLISKSMSFFQSLL